METKLKWTKQALIQHVYWGVPPPWQPSTFQRMGPATLPEHTIGNGQDLGLPAEFDDKFLKSSELHWSHQFAWINNARDKWASSWDDNTYHIGDQRRLRRPCASAQSHQSLRCTAHMKYGSRRRVKPKCRHLAPTGWLCMCVWRMSLQRTKSTIISWHGSNEVGEWVSVGVSCPTNVTETGPQIISSKKTRGVWRIKLATTDHTDGWFGAYILFNSISVISGYWKGEYEGLCTMKRCLGSERHFPPARF